MKRITLLVLLLTIVTLCLTGCTNKNETITLQETYDKVGAYFGDDSVDRSNLAAYSLDEKNNIVIVTLIDNSKEKQDTFMKQISVNPKYIKFEQGGPYYTTSDIDIFISKPEFHYDIKFNIYHTIDDRTIYLAGNLDEFYIVDNGIKENLKNYISNTFQTLDDALKHITDKLEQKEILRDGGTTIHKSKDKDISMVLCNKIEGNRNIFIGDYSMEYEQDMCN